MAQNEQIKTEQDLNKAVIDFHNKMLFMRLVNSGASYPAKKREEYLAQALDTAFAILSNLSGKKYVNSTELFKRIYTETRELVQGSYVTPEMEKMHSDFYTKTTPLAQNIAKISFDKGILR